MLNWKGGDAHGRDGGRLRVRMPCQTREEISFPVEKARPQDVKMTQKETRPGGCGCPKNTTRSIWTWLTKRTTANWWPWTWRKAIAGADALARSPNTKRSPPRKKATLSPRNSVQQLWHQVRGGKVTDLPSSKCMKSSTQRMKDILCKQSLGLIRHSACRGCCFAKNYKSACQFHEWQKACADNLELVKEHIFDGQVHLCLTGLSPTQG